MIIAHDHRNDVSRPALRHGSLNSLFQVALYLSKPQTLIQVMEPVLMEENAKKVSA
jgi:hypothetical protein